MWWHQPTVNTPDRVGFWVLSRHAEAVAVMRDPLTFSSGAGGTAIVDTPGAKVTLNQSDDPQHHRLRSLVNRGFTPTTIGRLEGDLRERAEIIVDAVPLGEPFDFVAVVAQEIAVAGDLRGVGGVAVRPGGAGPDCQRGLARRDR